MREPVAYRLPDLGEGMTEAEVMRWTVAVGDHVARDQVVVHVQTDKAEVELPAPEAGTVSRLGGAVGDLLTVGATLIEYVPDTPAAPTIPAAGRALPPSVAPVPAVEHGAPERRTGVYAAPPVRKLARELGVDLSTVAGTGPAGRISAADVRAAARSSAPRSPVAPTPPEEPRREPLRGIRRAMAHRMADAWREIPHATLFDEIDARPLQHALRAARDLSGDQSLTLTALLVRAAVVALTEHPILNATFDAAREELAYHTVCNIGIAVASPHGLVVPVVHDACSPSLAELGAEVKRLTDAARTGRIEPRDLAGATFTISNYGTEGGRFATPIVTPPQVGILGFGAIRARPLVHADTVIAAPTLPIALSVDHRVVDGHDAITFLEHTCRIVADPLPLLAARP